MKNTARFFLPLFCEQQKDLPTKPSLGRISFWMVLILALFKFWIDGQDIPGTMQMFLMTDFGYLIGTKGIHTYQGIKTNGNGQ